MGTSTLQFPFILLTLRGSGNHILLESQLLWITTHRAGGFWLNCWVRTATDSLISAAWQRICSSVPLAWHRWDFLRDPLLLWVGNSPSCELGFGFWKSQVLRCGSVSWDQQGKESWELRMDALFWGAGAALLPLVYLEWKHPSVPRERDPSELLEWKLSLISAAWQGIFYPW